MSLCQSATSSPVSCVPVSLCPVPNIPHPFIPCPHVTQAHVPIFHVPIHHPIFPPSQAPCPTSHVGCVPSSHVPMPLHPSCLYPYVPTPTQFSPRASHVPCVPAHGGSQRREVLPSQTSHIPKAQDGAQGLQLWVEATPAQLHPTARGWQVGPGDTGGHRGHEGMCHQAAVWGSWTHIPMSPHHLVPVSSCPLSPCPCVTPSLVLMSPRVPPVSCATHFSKPKSGKRMLFLMRRVKFSASSMTGLEEGG